MFENNNNDIREQELGASDEINQEQAKRIKVKVKRTSKLKRSTKRVINVVDILIILVVVGVVGALVAGISFRDVIFGSQENESKTVEYVVLFSGIDENLADTIKMGDKVYSEDGSVYLGQISSEVEVDDHYVVGYKDGAPTMKPYPGKVNLTVTVKVSADYSEGDGYSVDGNRIALGKSYLMRFSGLLAEGECINIGAGVS